MTPPAHVGTALGLLLTTAKRCSHVFSWWFHRRQITLDFIVEKEYIGDNTFIIFRRYPAKAWPLVWKIPSAAFPKVSGSPQEINSWRKLWWFMGWGQQWEDILVWRLVLEHPSPSIIPDSRNILKVTLKTIMLWDLGCLTDSSPYICVKTTLISSEIMLCYQATPRSWIWELPVTRSQGKTSVQHSL